MTVKELKEKLKNANDDAIIMLSSDTGVDQVEDGYEVIVEDAYGHNKIFYIYCNYIESEEEKEYDS